jgi:hypothetical protein
MFTFFRKGEGPSEPSGRPQAPGHFQSTLRIVPDVPSKDRLRLGFDGAVSKHSIIDSAANDAQCRRGFECIRVFIPIQRDHGKPFPYAADEQHSLLAANAVFARHPGHRGKHLGQTMRSAAASCFVELD